MLIWATRFSRKKAVFSVIGMGIVMAVLIILTGHITEPETPASPQLTDNAQRLEYLDSLGWQVDSEPIETLQFLMPDVLTEPYLAYNTLQLAQGFDLNTCCGKQVERYTYNVRNHPSRSESIQLNLYICEGLPVAGDVCCPGANGFQMSLQYPESDA